MYKKGLQSAAKQLKHLRMPIETLEPVMNLPSGVVRNDDIARPDIPNLSVIVPVFNEEDSVVPFLAAIEALDLSKVNLRVLFVNDGSRDKTLDVILAQTATRPWVSVINLARNFGKEAAMSAGIDYVDADAVIVMDVDLQDPVELIPEFLKHWKNGYDVVYGYRSERKTDTWLKRRSAGSFYKVFNKLSDTQIPENVGDFRLIDRRVVDALKSLGERNRFMKGLFAWVGYPSISVPYERPERFAGETKFNFRRLWNFALDGIFSFSNAPLKASMYLGFFSALGALLYAAFLIIRTIVMGIDLPGYASLMVVILTATAMQLFCIGILGSYVARITTETKKRPIYIVENHYKHEDA